MDQETDRGAERRLAAQYAAAQVLAEASTLAEATPRLLREVGERIGWQLGCVWAVDPKAGALRFVDLWHADEVDAAGFEAASRGLALLRGQGLPGRAWDWGSAVWIEDVVADPNFPRAPVAAEAGLHGAFCFPIRLRAEILGVVEFFSGRHQPRDETLLEAMEAIGRQIGQFIARTRVQEEVRESEARKSAILKAALDCIIAMDHEGRITEFNPAAERIFGYRREDVLGKEVADLIIPPSLRDEHRRGLARYLRTGEGEIIGRRVELTAMRSDGSEFPVELAITRVDLPGPPLFKGFVRDISQRRLAEEALRESEERLQQAMAAGRMGAWEWDLGTDEVRWSETLERIHGLAPGEFPGTFEAFLRDVHEDDRELVRAEISRTVSDGGEYRMEYRIVRPDGVERWLEARGRLHAGSGGEPTRMSGICTDVTERREAEELRAAFLERERAARTEAEAAGERLSFLAEAGKILSSSLNQDRTLAKIAKLVVPRLADWCVVYVLDEDGSIRRVVIEHVDPNKGELARRIEGFRIDPEAAEGVPKCLRTAAAELREQADAALLAADVDDPATLETLIEPLGVRSWMCVPLIARGRTLGAISFIAAESGRSYGPQDLALAEELCGYAALSIDNARLYEERSHVARTLQRSLLPPLLPEIPGVEVATRYEPAGEGLQVGGDFYDVFQRGRGDWVAAMGDVQGKGPEAAALTGLARHTLRAGAMEEGSPSRILSLLNEAILQEGTERFCTVVCVRLQPTDAGMQVTVACGGHPLPRILRSDGSVERLGRHGTLLGLFPDPELGEASTNLAPGDSLILFTDGVIEYREGEEPEEEVETALTKHVGEGAEALADVLETVARKRLSSGARDDVAVMVLTMRE